MSNGHALRLPLDQTTSIGDPLVTESHSVVKETNYDRGMDVDYLLGLLRNQRVTGTLRVDISQGGICAIRLEERRKLPPEK